jgi:hypothetical protein
MFAAAKVPTRERGRRMAQAPGTCLIRFANGKKANGNFVDGYWYKVNRNRWVVIRCAVVHPSHSARPREEGESSTAVAFLRRRFRNRIARIGVVRSRWSKGSD